MLIQKKLLHHLGHSRSSKEDINSMLPQTIRPHLGKKKINEEVGAGTQMRMGMVLVEKEEIFVVEEVDHLRHGTGEKMTEKGTDGLTILNRMVKVEAAEAVGVVLGEEGLLLKEIKGSRGSMTRRMRVTVVTVGTLKTSVEIWAI